MPNENVTAAARYEALAQDRQVFLERAREAAKYTIPALIPPEGFTASSQLYTPYQSLGARGVNNLASKLLLALLPPSSAFFRLQIDAKVAKEIQPQEWEAFDAALSDMEREILKEIELQATRVYAF